MVVRTTDSAHTQLLADFDQGKRSIIQPESPAPAESIEPLSIQDYIQTITVVFEKFQKDMPEEGYEFELTNLPSDYIRDPAFTATGMRVLTHNWANLVQGMKLLRPNLDFFENKTEMTEDKDALRNTSVTVHLMKAFEQFGQSIHLFRDEATDPAISERLEHFNETMLRLTERFAADKDDLNALPTYLKRPTNEHDPSVQTIGLRYSI